MKIERSFVVVKAQSHWNELVGRFTDRLNTVADSFLAAGKKEYPDGSKILKYNYPRMGMELSNYCKAMKSKEKEACLEELWFLCDKAKCGFTKAFWGLFHPLSVQRNEDPRRD